MRTFPPSLIVACLLLIGCAEELPSPETTAPAPAARAPASDVEVQTVAQVGCAACIYGMPGVEGCEYTAVKLDGATHIITGVELDAHDLGLCDQEKSARVEGTLKGEQFVASRVEVQ